MRNKKIVRRLMRPGLLLAMVPGAMMLTSCGPLPKGFTQQLVASGFELPTTWVQPSSTVQYVAEKSGNIRVVTSGQVRSAPLVDLSGHVNDRGDRGLVGMALDPNFTANGFLYLAYTYQDPAIEVDNVHQTQRITRIAINQATHVAAPSTEQVILGRVTGAACYDNWETPDCLPSNLPVHTVGDLNFDSSGMLWVSVGEGSGVPYTSDEASYRAQDVDVLAGKLLRIDPATGFGVPGNPFFQVANPTSNASRVYAYGFRNPLRFAFRPGSGTPFVGDVGAEKYEEINAVKAGGNYGWPCYEGNVRQAAFSTKAVCQPMYKANTPVIGPAAFYEHSDQGTSITGGVFYTGTSNYPADYVGNYVYGDYNAFVRRQKFTSADTKLGDAINFVAKKEAGAPVKFGIGPDGNLWYLSIYPGELRKLVYNGADATTPTTTSPVQPGSAPSIAVTSPADKLRVADGTQVAFTATANDAEDGALPPSAVTVDVAFLHYSSGTVHVHPYQTTPSATTGSFIASGAHGPGHYQIKARATDSSGRTSTSPPVNVCLNRQFYGPCT